MMQYSFAQTIFKNRHFLFVFAYDPGAEVASEFLQSADSDSSDQPDCHLHLRRRKGDKPDLEIPSY